MSILRRVMHMDGLGLALLTNTPVTAIDLNLGTLLPSRPDTIRPRHESTEAFMTYYIQPLVQYMSTNAYLRDVRIGGGRPGPQDEECYEAMATAFLLAIATHPAIQHVHYFSLPGVSITLFIQFLTRAVEARVLRGEQGNGWKSLRLESTLWHHHPTVHDVAVASSTLARLIYEHELETLHVSQFSSDFLAATFNSLISFASVTVDTDPSSTTSTMATFIALKELTLTGGITFTEPQHFAALARLLQFMATTATATATWEGTASLPLKLQQRLQHLQLRNFIFGQRNAADANDDGLSNLLRGLLVPNHVAVAAAADAAPTLTHAPTAVAGTTVAKLTLQRCTFYNAAADALIAFMQTPIVAPTAAEPPAAPARTMTGASNTVGSEGLPSLSPTSSSLRSSTMLEELCVDGTGLMRGAMFADRLAAALPELNRPAAAGRLRRADVLRRQATVTVERPTGAILAEMLVKRPPPETDESDTWDQQLAYPTYRRPTLVMPGPDKTDLQLTLEPP